MPNLNKVMLIGTLTRDPDLKHTQSGMAIADMGLAINRKTKEREETTFVDVTLWGRQAELAGQYLRKGRPVYIEGRLQLDSWEDRQSGQKRTKLKVIGESLQFLQSNKQGGQSNVGRAPVHAGAEDNDEIPF